MNNEQKDTYTLKFCVYFENFNKILTNKKFQYGEMRRLYNEHSLQVTEVDQDLDCVDYYARRKETQCFWLHQGWSHDDPWI